MEWRKKRGKRVVIPAKAGIQSAERWIPAFVGMTG
jgi:hypothetical protein